MATENAKVYTLRSSSPTGHEHSTPSSSPVVEFPHETHEEPSENDAFDDAAHELQVNPVPVTQSYGCFIDISLLLASLRNL